MFKIRINGTTLPYSFYGVSTGLDSAMDEFNLKFHHAKQNDLVELLFTDENSNTHVIKGDTKR